jgi:hypothetical protein
MPSIESFPNIWETAMETPIEMENPHIKIKPRQQVSLTAKSNPLELKINIEEYE